MQVLQQLKRYLDFLTTPFGIEIIRHFGDNLEMRQIVKLIETNNISLVLDIGANMGHYAQSLIDLGYNKRIISFEPLSDAYKILLKNSHDTKNWQAFERCAIGNEIGKASINIAQNSYSSSLLDVLNTHTTAAPQAEFISNETTPVLTLDSIAKQLKLSDEKIFMKIDTQGFEDRVIEGAKDSLKYIDLIQLELSLIPLYEGGKTIDWMIPFLNGLGYEPLFFLPGFTDRRTYQIQQVDGVFARRK